MGSKKQTSSNTQTSSGVPANLQTLITTTYSQTGINPLTQVNCIKNCQLYGITSNTFAAVQKYNGKLYNKQVATVAIWLCYNKQNINQLSYYKTSYNVFGLCFNTSGTLVKQFCGGNGRLYLYASSSLLQNWLQLAVTPKFNGQLVAAINLYAAAAKINPQTVLQQLKKPAATQKTA